MLIHLCLQHFSLSCLTPKALINAKPQALYFVYFAELTLLWGDAFEI